MFPVRQGVLPRYAPQTREEGPQHQEGVRRGRKTTGKLSILLTTMIKHVNNALIPI